MTRTRKEQQEHGTMPTVGVGGSDPMSEARRKFNVPGCTSESRTGRFCTRALGHDKADREHSSHPARRHVHLGPDNTVWEVW